MNMTNKDNEMLFPQKVSIFFSGNFDNAMAQNEDKRIKLKTILL